jgi:hypothetical protein
VSKRRKLHPFCRYAVLGNLGRKFSASYSYIDLGVKNIGNCVFFKLMSAPMNGPNLSANYHILLFKAAVSTLLQISLSVTVRPPLVREILQLMIYMCERVSTQ